MDSAKQNKKNNDKIENKNNISNKTMKHNTREYIYINIGENEKGNK